MNEAYLLHAVSVIATLIVLEGLLSADNALVLAVLVKHLPKARQRKALLYGIVGAFVFRFLMLVAAAWIIKFWYLCAAGAAYLAYLSVRHFVHQTSTKLRGVPRKKPGFWKTVMLVELTDVAFAIDSVIVAVALSSELWLIYTGGILGIIAMRFAAGGFLAILEKWPGLEQMAYVLIGWISVKLFVHSYGMYVGNRSIHLSPTVFWGGMAVIAVIGTITSLRQRKAEVARGEVAEKVP